MDRAGGKWAGGNEYQAARITIFALWPVFPSSVAVNVFDRNGKPLPGHWNQTLTDSFDFTLRADDRYKGLTWTGDDSDLAVGYTRVEATTPIEFLLFSRPWIRAGH
ncbi:MAG: hypothetical protein EHM61_00305 [Acidobacteria bacterium]|nr:MAG: hypothetical protein EHM61_00305 [Acidobacteriota bacterium]